MNLRRVHLTIQGLVQGVSYRASACDAARDLGLTGQVRNLRSGEVEAIAEGQPAAVMAFVEWCRRGPPEARVSGVVVQELSATGEFSSFEVTR